MIRSGRGHESPTVAADKTRRPSRAAHPRDGINRGGIRANARFPFSLRSVPAWNSLGKGSVPRSTTHRGDAMRKSLTALAAAATVRGWGNCHADDGGCPLGLVGPGPSRRFRRRRHHWQCVRAALLLRIRLRLLPSVRLRLFRRIFRLLRWLLGPWTSGGASRLASSRALGLIRVSMVIGRHCFAKVASGPWTEIVTTSGNNRLI